MIILKRSLTLCALVAAVTLAMPEALSAGGPLSVARTGQPYRWDVSSPILIHPDRGRLGKYSNAEAITQLVVPALARWAAVPTARVNWTNGGVLPRDIQSLEDLNWALDAGYSPIVFDQDGKILLQLGLPTQDVIALGGFMTPRGETIVQGLIILSGIWVDGNPANGEMTPEEMINAIAHEMGHFLNVGHSQVNGHMFFGGLDNPSNKMFGLPPADSVELMYPLYEPGIGTKRLTRDDEAAVSWLYPSDSLAYFGSVSGTVRRADGFTPFQGANVVARNIDNPFYDAVSGVSGARYLGESGGSYSYELLGLYDLRKLTPGARYMIEMVNLLAMGSEGSMIGPRFPHAQLAGPEEFYNGTAESFANPPDDPMQYSEIRMDPGQSMENLDFLFNREIPEGPPTLITYGRRSAAIDRPGEIDLFAFEAKGYEYVRIAVNIEQCCLTPAVEVFGPDGRYLAGAYGFGNELRLLVTSPGTYIIAVSDAGMTRLGQYKLTLEKLRDAPVPKAISYGQMKTGNLAEINQVDLYVLRGEAGDRLVASVGTHQGWYISLEVELRDSRGVLLDRSSYWDHKLVDTTLPASGEYLLAVRDPSGGYGGSYGLYVQRMNKPINPVAVQFGRTYSGLISAGGEIVTYTLTGTAGDVVTLRIGQAPGSPVDPTMYLYDPNGVPLHRPIGADAWIGKITLALPKTGEYAVVVADWYGSYQGAFGFSLQRLNNPGNAVAIDFGKLRAVSLTKPAEMFTCSWMSEAGDAVLLLGNVAADIGQLSTELYDPNGILVAEGPEYHSTFRIQADLEKSGRYSLLIYRRYDVTGDCSLIVQRLNNPGNATELAFGETRFDSIAAPGEAKTYTWTGSAGDSLALTAVAPPASQIYPWVAIYDPDGMAIDVGWSYQSKSAIKTLLLPKTGRYAALVSDQSGSSSGPYSIAVQRAPNPGNALPMEFGPTIRGELSQPGKMQSHQWTGRTGDAVFIRIAREPALSSALRMYIFDPEGIVFSSGMLTSTDTKETLIGGILAKSGPYVLVVSDTEGLGIGNYVLTASCAGCQPQQAGPASELHFPFSSSTSSGYQGFAVCNLSPSVSTLIFTAYDTSGSLLAQKQKVLAPGNQLAFMPHELFGQAIESRSGRVAVTSDAPNQKGFYLMFDPEVTFMDGSGSLTAGPYSMIMTESTPGPGTVVEIDIHNLQNYRSSPALELVAGDGSLRERRQVPLPPLGSLSGRLDELFTPEKVTADSYVRCNACNGIDAIQRLRQGTSLAVLKGFFSDRATNRLYSPQMAAGGGYFSKLSLVSYFASRIWISVYDEHGKPHAEAAANPIALDIPKGGKIVVDVGEVFGFDTDGEVHTGWLKIEWDYGTVWGSISLGDSSRGSMSSLPLTGVGVREAVISHVAQNSMYFTGIALLNFTKKPAIVSLDVFAKDASMVGRATLRLAPGERVSKLISELIPVIQNQIGGYVRISSNQDLIVYSIFGTNSLSVLSAIPAQPVK